MEFPTHAQAVIVGGGVGGASIAYHLTLMGWKDVVVIERHELTSGSTFHSAGLVGQLRTSSSLTQMMRYSTDLYRNLKKLTGVDPGWEEVGSLRIASSDERMVELKRVVGYSRAFGMPLDMLTARECQDLFPLMSLEDVRGGVLLKTDGQVDPTALTLALAAGAKARGAQILSNTRVTGIKVSNNEVKEVVTDKGVIKTDVVINAAGLWGNDIANMVGITLPIIPMAHLYLITKPVKDQPQSMPTMRDPDNLVYFRGTASGMVTGGYERQPKPWALNGVPQDWNFKLLEPDWDRFTPLMEAIIKRVPSMETVEIAQLLNGPEGFTPDSEFLLGPTSVRGFWVACAFCAHGLAGAGGIGKVMAEWIIDGHPEWDMWRLDVRRFGNQYGSQAFTLARTVETYGKYYDIHMPYEERESARPLRTLPGLSSTAGSGGGLRRERRMGAPELVHAQRAECPFRSGAGTQRLGAGSTGRLPLLQKSAPRAKLPRSSMRHPSRRSKSRDRAPATSCNSLCANDIDKPIGTVVYTQMLNAHGGIECDFTVTRLAPDRFMIVTGTMFGTHDMTHLRRYMPLDGTVYINDITSARTCYGLWGPRARDILQSITPRRCIERRLPVHDRQTDHDRQRPHAGTPRHVCRRAGLGTVCAVRIW